MIAIRYIYLVYRKIKKELIQSLLLMKKMARKMVLKGVVHSQTPGPGPNTHIRGSQSIDGIWTAPEIEI